LYFMTWRNFEREWPPLNSGWKLNAGVWSCYTHTYQFDIYNFICRTGHDVDMHTNSFTLVEITNKMQPCNRIYYSTVHWRLNVFRATYRSSSGALYLQPLVYIRMRWPAVVKSEWELAEPFPTQTWLRPLETRWAFNERWNNKFYYKVASCWLFLLSHTTMCGSMNIKVLPYSFFTDIMVGHHGHHTSHWQNGFIIQWT